jgi:hypothetical protein
MAKLTSLLKFHGSLDGLSAYKMEGLQEEILRRKGGPTKEQILHDPRFALTRKNNKETAGRSRASGLVLDTLGGLRPAVDQSCCGRLNALLKVVQEGDTLSPWGERHVRLTLGPGLLEGFNLRKVCPLEGVLLNPLTCTVDKAALSAAVHVPALLPGLNFVSPAQQPLYRVVASLGAVPDLFYRETGDHYFPAEGYRRVSAQTAWTGWFPVRGGSPATTLAVQLPEGPEVDTFSLVLTVGVQWGMVGAGGRVDITKKARSARIERVV